MKSIYKSLIVALTAAPLFTGCIEESMPTNIIIETQLEGSPRATEALIWAIPGHLNAAAELTSTAFDIGYPGIMRIRDLFTADFLTSSLGANYNHFWYWEEISVGLGPNYLYPQYPWNWFYTHVLTINKVIGAIDGETQNEELRQQLATAYGDRAWAYLDFARMYEVLPTDGYEVTPEILGLTLPWVDETTTEDQMRNNPRLTHDEMIAKIKNDLDKAAAYWVGATPRTTKTTPDLGVVYGLYARLYMWDAAYKAEIDGDATSAANVYAEAKKYAELAISTSGATPLTKDEWLSTTNGFNDSSFSSWMFCGQYVTADDAVQYPNYSWIGWTATEKTYGYSSTRLKAFPEIGAELYEKINDRDFRKLSYVAPEGSALSGREPFLDPSLTKDAFTQPYISIKFRPGGGATVDNLTGCAVAYPLMRVEEMYLIAAEAAAQNDPAAGKTLLENFMKTYRFSQYSCSAITKENIIKEIILQKRIELWGEGQTFFDLKRLDMPVIRAYEGTNWTWGTSTINTGRRPAWFNFCITNQECDNNAGIPRELNAPTPANRYTVLDQL